MSQTAHTPSSNSVATITHTIAVICGEVASDITVYHARTTETRVAITFGTALMNLHCASAAQGLLEAFVAARAAMARVPREVNVPAVPPYETFARTTLAIDWTRRPAYAIVPQSGPSKSHNTATHWVDLHCGPITFQVRDQLGLKSALSLLERTHKTAVAVFPGGSKYRANPAAEDYEPPR